MNLSGFLPKWIWAMMLTLSLGAAPVAAFDGERAMELIYDQCNLGARIPGTPAHKAGQEWIKDQLKKRGLTVREQPFKVRLPLSGKDADACNVWGLPSADPPTSPTVILSAHWDTRPWADKDPSGNNPTLLGANDGASGVAMMLELARELRQTSLRDHLVFAFWDAEDAGIDTQEDSWALGARYAAAHPPAWEKGVVLGINLDMVGGEDLKLYPETFSMNSAPWAVKGLWTLGQGLAPDLFPMAPAQAVTDDHLPWVNRGVPFIDLVGMNYRYWHTAGDRPEHCSAKVLEAVGNAVANFLLNEPRLAIKQGGAGPGGAVAGAR
jgi:hypothetical protein